MKKRWICMIGIWILILAACTPSQKLMDFEKRVSIECPKGWKVHLSQGEGPDRAESPESTQEQYAGIYLNSYESDQTVMEYAQSLAEGYEEILPIEAAEQSGKIIIISRKVRYGEAGAQAVFHQKGRLYQVVFYTNSDVLFEKYYDDFVEAAQSVVFISGVRE